jgi:hypothetical protein
MVAVAALSVLFCSGCGIMKVREAHYYAVPGESGTNYFRLNVHATTVLGKTEYRSGFFPASAVDSLFGGVNAEGGVKALETRGQLEKQIRDSLIKINADYQGKAQVPGTSEQELNQLLEARRRVLAYPMGNPEGLKDTIEVDYNPAKGLAIRRWDEKLVFILSSNPDEVVGKIANFVESDKTVSSINQLAKVTAQSSRNELVGREATEEVNGERDALINLQIKKALAVLGNSPVAKDKDMALEEIDLLINLLNDVRR